MMFMEEEGYSKPQDKPGLPGWVMTFADLMSLLMCFFVLLLSFSEMDVQKFKQIAGSMKDAFGVQTLIRIKDIPKGTSIVAQEFSPGKPTPTVIDDYRQQTTDETKENLDFSDSKFKNSGNDLEKMKEIVEQQRKKEIEKQAEIIKQSLQDDIQEGLLEIETINDEVLIRIRERGSFPSGNADIQESFYPIMDKMGKLLKNIKGRIVVAGHTDDRPISTAQFPSNWVLSAARAANVVHYFSEYSKVPHENMEIRAHADVLPVMPNDTLENRAQNRRVEIVIRFDDEYAGETISTDAALQGYPSSEEVNE